MPAPKTAFKQLSWLPAASYTNFLSNFREYGQIVDDNYELHTKDTIQRAMLQTAVTDGYLVVTRQSGPESLVVIEMLPAGVQFLSEQEDIGNILARPLARKIFRRALQPFELIERKIRNVYTPALKAHWTSWHAWYLAGLGAAFFFGLGLLLFGH